MVLVPVKGMAARTIEVRAGTDQILAPPGKEVQLVTWGQTGPVVDPVGVAASRVMDPPTAQSLPVARCIAKQDVFVVETPAGAVVGAGRVEADLHYLDPSVLCPSIEGQTQNGGPSKERSKEQAKLPHAEATQQRPAMTAVAIATGKRRTARKRHRAI